MSKLLDVLLVSIVLFIWGWIFAECLKDDPEPITTVVNAPPTDDQLLEFWFGAGDKAALRKRICK